MKEKHDFGKIIEEMNSENVVVDNSIILFSSNYYLTKNRECISHVADSVSCKYILHELGYTYDNGESLSDKIQRTEEAFLVNSDKTVTRLTFRNVTELFYKENSNPNVYFSGFYKRSIKK